jgi:hypothetical protein
MEDNEVRAIASLDPTDDRLVDARVAGIAALLIAKAYKLGERANDPAGDRLVSKDASDVIGLMLASDPLEVGETLARLVKQGHAAELTRQGLVYLDQLFRASAPVGVNLAVQALDGIRNADEIRRLAPAYISALPAELRRPDAAP